MILDRRRLLLSTAATAVAAASAPPALGQNAPVRPQAPGFYRMRVGSTIVTAINDGWIALDLKFYPEADKNEAARLLQAESQPPTAPPSAVNAFLVENGDRMILIDAGAGRIDAMGPTMGRLAGNLAAAGVDPGRIDTVLLTHLHFDHSGGLVDNGRPTFPNAEIVVAEPEYAFWHDDGILARAPAGAAPFFEMARAVLRPYAGRVRRFAPGTEVAPGVVGVGAPGHTLGHTAFRLTSGPDALLVWGDIVHTPALQFTRPEWAISFDTDPAQAIETRRRLFAQAASERMLVGGAHLNFPGIGTVAREGQGYRFAPTFWRPEL